MKRLAIALAMATGLTLLLLAPVGAADTVTVTLTPQNNSGESGTATLTAMGDQTMVTLDLTGAPDNPQPAHIHEGTCANLNPQPKYPLTNVEGGKSETTVPVSLASLLTGGFAINVHKSAQEVSTYFACGNIPASAQVAPQTGHAQATGMGMGMMAAGLLVLAGVAFAGGLALRRSAR